MMRGETPYHVNCVMRRIAQRLKLQEDDRMKKRIWISGMCLLLFLLTSCSGNGADGGADASGEAQEKTAQADSDQTGEEGQAAEKQAEEEDGEKERTLILAHIQPGDSVANESMTILKEEVEGQDEISLGIEVYPDAALGSENDLLKGLSLGSIDMAFISNTFLEQYEPEFAIFSLPYLFEDYEHVHKYVESGLAQEMIDRLANEHDIRVLGFYDQGFRQMWNNVRPVNSISDLSGMRIRVPESGIYEAAIEALGAETYVLPWEELYTSLQTGVVDGYEVYLESVVANGTDAVTKYGTMTNHIYAGGVLLVNEEVYGSLSEREQEILNLAVEASAEYNNQTIVKNEEEYLSALAEAGVEINSLSKEALNGFQASVSPVYDEYAGKAGGMERIEEVRALAE